jgi:hypothetical protein
MVQVEKYRNLFKRYMPVQNKVCNRYVYIRKEIGILFLGFKIRPTNGQKYGLTTVIIGVVGVLPLVAPLVVVTRPGQHFLRGGNPSSCSERGIFLKSLKETLMVHRRPFCPLALAAWDGNEGR